MANEYLDRWATSASTRSEPSAAQKASGYVKGTQPVAKNWNHENGTTKDKLNELIKDLPTGYPPNQGYSEIISQYIENDGSAGWAFPNDDPNFFNAGTARAWGSICLWINTSEDDPSAQKKILALDCNATREILVIDIETMTLELTTNDLGGANLPSGGGETWIPMAMCADGTSVYVMFEDTNASPNETHRVQAYDISTGATWSRKSAWPATGTALPSTGPSNPNYSDYIRQVSSTQIATANSWNTFGGNDMISLLNMSNGSLTASGDGDATSGQPLGLCGDGDYVYFFTNADDVCSLDLTAPASGTGNTNWPYGGSSSTIGGIVHTGNLIITTRHQNSGTSIVRYHTVDQGHLAFSATGDDRVCHEMGRCTWDGLNLWVKSVVVAGASDRDAVTCMRVTNVTPAGASPGTATPTPAVEVLVKTTVVLDYFNTGGGTGELNAPIIFDGSNILVVGDHQDGNTLSGRIYKIPRAVIR
jgi:hypothetical protein